MRALALDLSLTATGWARSCPVSMEHPQGWGRGTIRPKSRGVERLQDVLDKVLRLAVEVDVALIEGYALSARASHSHSLGELGGVVRLGLHQRGVPFVEVPPATLKILATGKGNAGKELVLVEAVKRLGYTGSDNNEADALWLLQAVLIHYGLPGAVDLPKTHHRAFQKLTFPELGVLA